MGYVYLLIFRNLCTGEHPTEIFSTKDP